MPLVARSAGSLPPHSPASCRRAKPLASPPAGGGYTAALLSERSVAPAGSGSRFPSPAPPASGPAGEGAAEDSRLVAELVGGDEIALATVRRWIRGAFTPYRARLAADLEDVEQQVLLELLGALAAGRFEGRSRLATYVRRMVHHKCLNRLRALRGRQWVEVETLDLPDPGPAPDERAGRDAARGVALRVLAAMPESCRELWEMILRGLGYEEMAARLGVAAGTLRVRVLRCRQRAIAERDRLAAVSGVTPAPAGGRREG